MKNSVGPLGLSGSTGFSEKYNLRVRTGATSPSHGRPGLGRGSEEPASLERGSGAPCDTAILAIARLGSFSPPGPVSTLLVTRSAVTPAGGPFTINSTRAPGGTPRWVCQLTGSDFPF